jgi:hypothetical protein
MEGEMKIQPLYVSECPNVNVARTLLAECLAELKPAVTVEDKEGAYPSPAILVNGVDVMGGPASQAATSPRRAWPENRR